jgi:flagellar motor switch protein FliN
MQDLSRSELEAIFKAIDPSGTIKKEGLKDPIPAKEEKMPHPVSPSVSRVQLSQLQKSIPSETPILTTESMRNVHLCLNVILGKSCITLAQLLELRSGDTLPLDKLAGEPVDIELNGQIIGKGEIVVIDDNFGIQITQLSQPN